MNQRQVKLLKAQQKNLSDTKNLLITKVDTVKVYGKSPDYCTDEVAEVDPVQLIGSRSSRKELVMMQVNNDQFDVIDR